MEGDNYAYQLKKDLSEPVPFDKIGNISESKLYYHFESLTKQGLIAPTEIIKEDNRPDKQLFAITDKGREALPKKIYEVFEKATKMAEVIIGLMFVHHVDVEKVIALIQVKKMNLENKRQKIAFIYDNVNAPNHLQSKVQLANAYLTEMIQKEIAWFDRVIHELQHDKK